MSAPLGPVSTLAPVGNQVAGLHPHALAMLLPVMALAVLAGWVWIGLRGLAAEMRRLDSDLALARATPMTVRVSVRPTTTATGDDWGDARASVGAIDAVARADAMRADTAREVQPRARAIIVPDRSPLLALAPAGRAAA